MCQWTDVGGGITGLDSALSTAGLPESFWSTPEGGGHQQIWGINEWALSLWRTARSGDHFDLIACPAPLFVPATGGGIESALPAVATPGGGLARLWIFWDTVANPPAGVLPPIVGRAFKEVRVPDPEPELAPPSVDGISHATAVNLPTWFWIAPGEWHDVVARAVGGGLVATVWATPVEVTWQSGWDLPLGSDDPEDGVTLGPESLDLTCTGPGTAYDAAEPFSDQSSSCSFVFTQSSFGLYEPLAVHIVWSVTWGLADAAGVVGGEGSLRAITTATVTPLRVVQIESVAAPG